MFRKGSYGGSLNLFRKYLGDYLVATYLNDVQNSGYDDAYVREIEVCVLLSFQFFKNLGFGSVTCVKFWVQRTVILKALDSFWRDHLVNMNRLSSAVPCSPSLTFPSLSC